MNKSFVNENKDNFLGIHYRSFFDDDSFDAYKLAERCIKKKTHFALDIIYHSNQKLSNWQIPAYIKEGLIWLKKD